MAHDRLILPSLCPWHFGEFEPQVVQNGGRLAWRHFSATKARRVSGVLLEDESGDCKGIVPIYHYLLPDSKGDTFLVWVRSLSKVTHSVELHLYRTDDLLTIENVADTLDSMEEYPSQCLFRANPQVSVRIPTRAESQPSLGTLGAFCDFCIVTEIPGLYGSDADTSWWQTAIIKVSPKANRMCVYPQDWFNKSDADFGYQWITRAWVDSRTGKICGQGIRITDFRLDGTNCNLEAS